MKQNTRWTIVSWVVAAGLLQAQTKVDLRTQSKSVDFRTATSTSPVKSGVTLPATCIVAEMFYLTTAPAGQNIYTCPSTNTWVVSSGSGGGTAPGGLNTQCQFNDAGSFGGDSGCTFDKASGVLSVAGGVHSGDGAQSSGLILPELAAHGSDYFAIYGADSQAASGCIMISGSPASSGDVLAYTGATANTTETVPKTCKVMQWASPLNSLMGSAVIDFASLSAGQCSSNSFTVNGATAGARVAPGYPAAMEAGLVGRMSVSAANTVAVQLCNLSGSTLDPASGTFSATLF